VFPFESVNFLCHVNKINKRNVVQPRLLIIGKFHFCSIKLAVLKPPSIKRTGSLLDVENIEANLPNDEVGMRSILSFSVASLSSSFFESSGDDDQTMDHERTATE